VTLDDRPHDSREVLPVKTLYSGPRRKWFPFDVRCVPCFEPLGPFPTAAALKSRRLRSSRSQLTVKIPPSFSCPQSGGSTKTPPRRVEPSSFGIEFSSLVEVVVECDARPARDGHWISACELRRRAYWSLLPGIYLLPFPLIVVVF